MADTNLAVNTTPGNIISQMKAKLGIESRQLSQINPNRLIEILHDAIQAVRDQNIAALEWFYRYKISPSLIHTPNVADIVSITTNNAADLKTMTVTSSTKTPYRIMSNPEFELYETLYTAAELESMYIGTVRANSGVLSLELYGATGSTVNITYLRNPRKVTGATSDKVDIPDNYVPFVVEMAVKLVKEEPIYASAK